MHEKCIDGLNTEIIIIKFGAPYTTLVCTNPFVHRIWEFTHDIALKTNTAKWKVSLLGVSKATLKHLGKPDLLLRVEIFTSARAIFRQVNLKQTTITYMYFILDNGDKELQICPQELNVSPLILFLKVQ